VELLEENPTIRLVEFGNAGNWGRMFVLNHVRAATKAPSASVPAPQGALV
jgi:hypothetical protein